MKNKIITVKRILILSVIGFFIYYATYPKDGTPPSDNMLTLGGISLVSIIICSLILFSRMIKRKAALKQELALNQDFQNKTNQEIKKHQECFKSKKQPIKTTSYDSFNPDDEDDYQDYDDLFQDKDFSSFDDSLETIWNKDSHHIISFDYSNASREIQLTAVKINDRNEVYFVGYCFDSNDDRKFKAERISGHIKYAGEQYRIAKFLTQELGLDLDYVKGLDF